MVYILSDFNAAPHAVKLSPNKKRTQQASVLDATKWINSSRTCKNTSFSGPVLTGSICRGAVKGCMDVPLFTFLESEIRIALLI